MESRSRCELVLFRVCLQLCSDCVLLAVLCLLRWLHSQGTVLCPLADASLTNGRIDGSGYFSSLSGDGGITYSPPLTPPCPVTPCPPCPTPQPFPAFTAFAIGNLDLSSSQSTGAVAGGDSATLTSYSVTAASTSTACPLSVLRSAAFALSQIY